MSKNEFDIFHQTEVYPNADKIFVTELPSINSIKDNCIFVLDTNALLVPFSTGSQSLDEISKIFNNLKKKKQLKVPDQVAREFADNRPKKIGEMFHALNQKRNGMNSPTIGSYPLLEKLEEYGEALSFEKEINELLKKYRTSIGKVIDTVKSWSWDDPVSIIYKKIFTPDIIHQIKFDKLEVEKDLEYRYKHKIPPGYKDNSKEDSGIGDYLIWLAIKDIGEKYKKNVVFVSGDEKPDWYHKSDKLPLYPRFELLTEFNNISGNKSFHIIRLSELLNVMGADEQVVSEVKTEEQLEIERFATPLYMVAEKAVYQFYKNRFGSVIIENQGRGNVFDFTYFDGDSIETGIYVVSLRDDFRASIFFVKDKIRRLLDKMNYLKIQFVDVVIVFRSQQPYLQDVNSKLIEYFSSLGIPNNNVKLYIGYLDEIGGLNLM